MVAFIFQLNQFPDLVHSGTTQVLVVAQQQGWHLSDKGMESAKEGKWGLLASISHLEKVSEPKLQAQRNTSQRFILVK